MQRVRLDQDIHPLSEFRANTASLLEQVRETKRPLVITQRGHSSAVVLDVGEYERLVDELELLRDVRQAEEQLARGEGIAHDEARRQLLTRFDG